MKNTLYYGDNLEVMRKHIRDESVNLCYIDPPFNSKRNYNQIYNNVGHEDRAQAQAFVDTWTWDDHANECFGQILTNVNGVQTRQSIELMRGLDAVLGRGSLFAYLVSMTIRIAEIHRTLKTTGSFYLHCDPTASHYLKLACDAIFCGDRGGDFKSEIIWKRTGSHNSAKRYGPIHDVIFFYTKSAAYIWNKVHRPYLTGHVDTYFKQQDERGKYWSNALTGSGTRNGESGKSWRNFNPTAKGRHWAIPSVLVEELGIEDLPLLEKLEAMYQAGGINLPQSSEGMPEYRQYLHTSKGIPLQDIWAYQPHTKGCVYGKTNECIDEDVRWIGKRGDAERLGYPTQKPESLLERIIVASSNEGDTILDAYCGCGTTIAVAQRLKRRWVGIDITYQSVSLMLRRLEQTYGSEVLDGITLDGIPRDMESALALAHKKDDRVRKEFEKWAVLTYTNNRAIINDKKGADKGIDGVAYFLTGKNENAKIIFQVKSGGVKRSDVATLRGDMEREQAVIAVLITLEKPSRQMNEEAKGAGTYHHEMMNRSYDKIQIVTIKEIIEQDKRLDVPTSLEVLKAARRTVTENQMDLEYSAA